MSKSDDGCLGCLGRLLVIGVIGLVIYGVDLYQGSQYGMMKEARNHQECRYYLNYIEKYSDGRYAGEAKDSIVSLSRKQNDIRWIYNVIEKLKLDTVCQSLAAIAYNHVSLSDSENDWKEYVEMVPSQYHWDATAKIDSFRRIAAMEENKRWATEKLAWQTVSETKSIDNLKKYLALYPKGAHRNEVKKELIDFEVARDFAGEHGTMPAMDRTSIGTGKFSTVRITNDTSYEMTLLYSGDIESERMVIPARKTRSVRLPNGHYRISARVDASGVTPYVGREDLEGGEYSSSYYITTTRY